uniref:Uncharacterized protein n=1 Tax=Chromera velia CCMP2878 TaxID=1169474 RepID=A0A0G4GAK6_9ALVE|eukprot:Cvel_21010.t1-p1 / transcript=Cvel_21010.t1 / gene=Cvel_21010 / organism=Chromera_velia_CCMP2878 / gene_product=hypothetical protein / transcript_product=hypothetical protein / location=Cvel_scaffold1936:13844-22045(-) / protein_length=150 / sequence_SO=supercontig / SO=protein_coding / is_pseudo=false
MYGVVIRHPLLKRWYMKMAEVLGLESAKRVKVWDFDWSYVEVLTNGTTVSRMTGGSRFWREAWMEEAGPDPADAGAIGTAPPPAAGIISTSLSACWKDSLGWEEGFQRKKRGKKELSKNFVIVFCGEVEKKEKDLAESGKRSFAGDFGSA